MSEDKAKEQQQQLIASMFEGLTQEEAEALDGVYRSTYEDWLKSGRTAVQKATVRRKQEKLQKQYESEMKQLLERGGTKYERLKLRDTWRSKGLDI